MKSQKHLLFWSIILLTSSSVNAQSAPSIKPSIFNLHPTTISIPVQTLQNVMNLEQGIAVTLPLTSTFHLIGNVSSAIQKYANLKTVVIKLANYPNVNFMLTNVKDENGVDKYVGRIIGLQFFDAYELVQNNGSYQLEKKQTDHLVMPCNK